VRPSFRYHVATLTAIFLALGLGIIIGTAFVSSFVVERQTRMLASLRDQFARELEPKRMESDRYARFVASLNPWLIQGKLTGKRVAVVQTGDYPDAARGVKEIVESAGATTSTIVIDRGFPTRAQTNLSAVLPKLRAMHPELPADASALLTTIGQVLAHGGRTDLQPMEDARLLRSDGDFSQPSDYVILVGGASLENESRAEALDLPLIKYLRDRGTVVLAAEPLDPAISYVPLLKGADVAIVDNADTDIGRIAIVLAFRAERGHYGVRNSASSILPSPPPDNDIRRSAGP
jgi:hypothetical protein